MPQTRVILYRDDDGIVPLIKWLDRLQPKAQLKCLASLKRLEDMGYELRRPEADYLRDDIHELRIRFGRVNLRMLYFFHGRDAVVVSHGLSKQDKVPRRDIELAKRRRAQFESDPLKHTFSEQSNHVQEASIRIPGAPTPRSSLHRQERTTAGGVRGGSPEFPGGEGHLRSSLRCGPDTGCSRETDRHVTLRHLAARGC
ncbi:MAG TPA: type II toxin-antitoxin system RelE/ParE family toxin [Candidatus Eisenbacteria bacterium]